MDRVVELNAHREMNVDQTIGRVSRRNLKKIIIVGLCQDDSIFLASSVMSDQEAYWLLNQSSSFVLNG